MCALGTLHSAQGTVYSEKYTAHSVFWVQCTEYNTLGTVHRTKCKGCNALVSKVQFTTLYFA